jgi:hypothetical protein
MSDQSPAAAHAASSAAVLDLDAFEDVDRATVRIKNPTTGAPTPMTVVIAGPEHPDRRRLDMARARRLRAAMVKTGKLPMGDPEEDEAERLDELVACTLDWQGASMPYSREAARKLYSDPKRRWLRDQVQAALQERELFTRACVTA